MLNKNFVQFLITLVFFLSASIYMLVIYWSWNEKPSPSETSLEVSLPVMNWEKYMNLSKHLE
jgi:hypothetical protein